MPRSRQLDRLQDHRFWLVDIMPSAVYPFYVLGSPLLGFQTISAPEITLESDKVKQLNSMYKRSVYTGGDVSPITLTRGVSMYDNTFWSWLQIALRGYDFPNRDLLLIHFSQIGGKLEIPVPIDSWEGIQRVPGKAWLLWDCIPTRYKAASDFDAASGQVSIAELEIQPWAIEEFTLVSLESAVIGWIAAAFG